MLYEYDELAGLFLVRAISPSLIPLFLSLSPEVRPRGCRVPRALV